MRKVKSSWETEHTVLLGKTPNACLKGSVLIIRNHLSRPVTDTRCAIQD